MISRSRYQTCITTSLIRRLFYSRTIHLDNTIRLYDSLNGKIETLPESSEKALAWYTCGPTTYAPAHMGHARTYVCLDIMRRVIEANNVSKPPLFVMNITDVDDKILKQATELGSSPLELARRYEEEFWNDLDALNCKRPHVITRVTERIESDIIPYIQRLFDQGMAYETEDGVYFDIRSFNEKSGHLTKYGKLAPNAAAKDLSLSESSRDTAVSKKDSRDFVLWKKQKDNEVFWESPWGKGRPGWHIECSAMIEAVQTQFKDTHKFLVHAGGSDLKFPHHTNEIAQAEAYGGKEWIPHWVHTGHLHIDGLKMSKSLKNFVSIQEFLSDFDLELPLESPGDDFRLWCLGLSGSYRGPATFSRKQIAEARTLRQRIVRFLIDGENWVIHSPVSRTRIWGGEENSLFHLSAKMRENCLHALKSDLDGSKFLSEILEMVEFGNAYLAEKREGPVEPMREALENIRFLLSLVGFSKKTTEIGLNLVGGRDMSESSDRYYNAMNQLAFFRSGVRDSIINQNKEKDGKILQLCDEVRESMLQHGVELLDGKEVEKDSWRFCLPKSTNSEVTKPQVPTMDPLSISLEDYFRVGKYKGMFSEYSSDGMPIRNADGSELSKRLLKKLKKKHETHKKRLKESPEQEVKI